MTSKHLRLVIGCLSIGGAEHHLAQILPALHSKGWAIDVLTFQGGGALEEVIRSQGIHVHSPQTYPLITRLPRLLRRPITTLRCLLFLFRDFRKYPFKISHFFLPESYLLGMVAAWIAGSQGPKLMSRRCLNSYQKTYPLLAWFEKKLHSHTAFILGNSQAILDQLHQEEGVPLEKLRLIYNGVDLSRFQKRISKVKILQSLGIPKNAFVIIIVANLIPYKGHQDLLNALFLIQKDLPPLWRLVCVGEDRGIGRTLKKQARDLNLSEHLVWLGSRQDVPELLRAADIGVLPSHQEGFSNAVIEGMASKLPMVVTDVGGNKEAVIHQETGLVVPPHAPSKLAEALLDLFQHPEKAKKYGQKGALRVKEKFSYERVIEAYEDLYTSLLERVSRCVE